MYNINIRAISDQTGRADPFPDFLPLFYAMSLWQSSARFPPGRQRLYLNKLQKVAPRCQIAQKPAPLCNANGNSYPACNQPALAKLSLVRELIDQLFPPQPLVPGNQHPSEMPGELGWRGARLCRGGLIRLSP